MITRKWQKTIPDFSNKLSILRAVAFMYVHVGFFNEDFQFAELNQTGIQPDCVETVPKILQSLKEISVIPYVSLSKGFTVTLCCLSRKFSPQYTCDMIATS